jgi:DNA recombination protein RmuC
MLLMILIALAGLGVGALAGWILAGSRSGAEKRRADTLAIELAQRASDLDAGRQREVAQREQISGHLTQIAKQNEQITVLNEQTTVLREQNARLEAEKQHLLQAAETLAQVRAANDQLRNDISTLQAQIAQFKARLESEQSNVERITAARMELSNQFEALANRILEEKSKRFTDQNQANLGNLLNPLREKFGEFQQKVESLEKDGIAGRSELKTQIEQLRSLNAQLSTDATNLVTALRGSSQKQGAWGEYVLESILEACGLRKDIEYRTQESFNREDGSRAKPDVILYLPEDRHLIIDSKVSLNDYNDYCNSDQELLREAARTRHLSSVRNHIKELSQRNYHTLYGLNSPDFVIMFVPIEPAFMLALASDGKLWEGAWGKNILLVGPSTLLFVLRIVAQLGRQEQQKKNVQEIVRRGGELYDKLAAFAKDLTDVGKKLDDARGAYDEAYKKLAEGKGNVIRQAEMLKSLGIKPTKTMPAAMRDLAMEQELFDEPDESETPLELAASAESTPSREDE